MRIINELLQHAQVDLILGGLDTGTALEHLCFRNLILPTLLHDTESGRFFDPDDQRGNDEVWSAPQ